MTTILSESSARLGEASTHVKDAARAKPGDRVYFPALDGLRAVAFLMVFADHYLQMPWGWAGVDVFFVLSGFLITGILFDTRDALHRARNFYARRILRIFPLYFGVIVTLLLIYPRYHWEWNWSWLLWPAYLGNFARFLVPYVASSPFGKMADAQLASKSFGYIILYFGHFWSLCVEEQFYLIWPWVVFRIKDRRKLILVCASAVVVCPLLRLLASHTLSQSKLSAEVLYRATPFRVDALLLGGLVALLRRGPHARALLLAARIGFALLATAALLWLAVNPSIWRPAIYTYPPWHFTWGLSFIDLLAACIIVLALECNSVTFRVLTLRPLRWLGRISYGAYVFHDIFHLRYLQVTQHALRHLHLHETYLKQEAAALAFVCTLILSWASFRWFETPFIRLKSRFRWD